MVHYQKPRYLAIHTQRISACTDLSHVVLSWMIACTQLETFLCNLQLISMVLPQREICLSQVLSIDVEVSPDQGTYWVVACIWIGNILSKAHSSISASPVAHLVLANRQCLLCAACTCSIQGALHV